MGTSINPWTNILSPKSALSVLQILVIGQLLPAIFALIGRIWTLNLQRPELTEVP